MHELLYPLFQAYDSVALEADVELGARSRSLICSWDGTFSAITIWKEDSRNFLKWSYDANSCGSGRSTQMSKSLGNYIGITEPPDEMFRKIMSIPDDLMWSYYELVTDFPPLDC